MFSVFFFNDTATTEIYTLSLHDALPIYGRRRASGDGSARCSRLVIGRRRAARQAAAALPTRRSARAHRALRAHPRSQASRSEEHTSELQSRQYLVCRLLLEKKKKNH